MARRFARRPDSAVLRVYFLAFVFLCGLGALVAKLWYEQVLRGPRWTSKLASRSEVTVRIPSVRGEIRDRNGLTLVENRASYEVDFYLPDMVRGYRQQMGKVPQTEYLQTVKQMKTKMREPDIVRIVNDTVVPRLDELKLAEDYNAERLQKHYRNDTEVPFTYREEIDFPTIAKFSEHDVGLPGVEIGIKPVRRYRYGALAAHLLGYVGAVKNIDQQPDVKDYTFYQPDVDGKSQVELYMNKWISGKPGTRVMQRNVKGVIEGEVRREPPKQGNNVYLTIDAKIQFIAERALRQSGIGRGAAVVVNPNNGEILAMASVPSFDPNMFIPSVSAVDWKSLNDDETDPLTNRAIQGYAPGSTYKTVTALAGLRAGIPVTRTYNCSGGVQYGAKYMKCWVLAQHMAPHGTLTLPDALKQSCNAFFYQWGVAAGIDQIDAVGDALGLGKKTGVPLSGESPGILPSKDWLRLISPTERWSDGYTANTSIGQGFVLASPLQMAMVVSTIANRGISYEPRLIYRVLDQQGHDVVDPETGKLVAPHEPKVRADLHQAGITDQQIEYVREGMRRVVADGTGKKAQIKGITVAGKTGTAQFWRGTKKDNHTWFITFAPYEEPKYAICIMVQGAKSGGGVSAPIAQKIMEECFSMEKGYDPGLETMTPAVGSFAQIDLVDFKKSAVPGAIAGQLAETDEERADHAADPQHTDEQKNRGGFAPDIRTQADARGKIPPKATRVAPPAEERRNIFQKIFGIKLGPPRPQPPQRPGGR
jgi:penicillin-binding protein 2